MPGHGHGLKLALPLSCKVWMWLERRNADNQNAHNDHSFYTLIDNVVDVRKQRE